MKYQISQDGVIYSINSDETITKYGRISADGSIEPIGNRRRNSPTTIETRRRPVWGYWLVIILLLIGCGALGFVVWIDTDRNDSLNHRISELTGQYNSNANSLRQKDQLIENLQNQLADASRRRVAAENQLSQLTDAALANGPLMVSSVDYRNTTAGDKPLGPWGAPLKSSTLCFLMPRLNYYGLTSGMHNLSVKIFRPDGRMLGTGTYSFTNTRPIEPGAGHQLQLSGYGYKEAGRWPSGTYRLELYSSGTCIYRTHFEVD